MRRVFDRAVGAVALADGVVEAPRTRSGKLGGIFNTQVRGFVFEELPYPIEYEFDSFQMTQRGLQNAEVMLEHLLSNQPASIVLEGHTDPTGEANYNLTLSLQRAQAAQTFFEDGGFVGVVSVEGRGESMRIDPDLHNVAFDSAEHHQLERRVVLIRE